MDKAEKEFAMKAYNSIFQPIEDAIFDTLGVDNSVLKNKVKSKIYTYSRMIFSYLCRSKGLTLQVIGCRINKDHSTIVYYLSQYEDNYKYDKVFICLANAVMKRLKEIENGE